MMRLDMVRGSGSFEGFVLLDSVLFFDGLYVMSQ